ncbi:hypothetical protein B296_00008691 [Ensete ventricosum]|uniref:Phytocyanin domain-containing protein n=1 Tax=Ensete ventricosum TaxID=4639 RepID=A0A426ZCX3_ENSVE|nr:hypothetical protein B296_00008691 [Ensete ventricosum]
MSTWPLSRRERASTLDVDVAIGLTCTWVSWVGPLFVLSTLKPTIRPANYRRDGWLRRVDERNGINISLLFRVSSSFILLPALPPPHFHSHVSTICFPPLLVFFFFFFFTTDMAASFGGSFAAAAAVVAMLLTSAQAVQHIVGDDHGWDVSSDVAAWTIDRIFRVGDNISKNCMLIVVLAGFAYSAAEESLMELQNKEEYESCDLSNPIRMSVNGLDRVSLDGEGTRYFSSGKLENCRKGLKLHVDVMPGEVMSDGVAASAPDSSASSIHLKATYLLWIAIAINLARVWP